MGLVAEQVLMGFVCPNDLMPPCRNGGISRSPECRLYRDSVNMQYKAWCWLEYREGELQKMAYHKALNAIKYISTKKHKKNVFMLFCTFN